MPRPFTVGLTADFVTGEVRLFDNAGLEELRKAGVRKVDEWKKAAVKGQVIYGPVMNVSGVTSSAGITG